jgi:hypothetical protein
MVYSWFIIYLFKHQLAYNISFIDFQFLIHHNHLNHVDFGFYIFYFQKSCYLIANYLSIGLGI